MGGGAPPLVIENLVHRFGGVTAVDGVSLEVAPEERVAVIGPNGAGKTTLFRLIAGEFRPSEGKISLFGQDVTRFSVQKRARMGLSRTFQVSNLFLNLTALENVRVALQAGRPDRWKFWSRIRSGDELERPGALGTEWASPSGPRSPHPTSPRRAAARDRRRSPPIRSSSCWTSQPPGVGSRANPLLRRFRTCPPVALLLIEHDMSFAMTLSDRVLCLDNGKPVALGRPDGALRPLRQAVPGEGGLMLEVEPPLRVRKAVLQGSTCGWRSAWRWRFSAAMG